MTETMTLPSATETITMPSAVETEPIISEDDFKYIPTE